MSWRRGLPDYRPWPGWSVAVVSDPRRAWMQGPPNGMVLHMAKKGEDHPEAALRVKTECFEELNPEYLSLQAKLSLQDVPTPEEVMPRDPNPKRNSITAGLCADCGVKPRDGRNKQCSACRKKGQRG